MQTTSSKTTPFCQEKAERPNLQKTKICVTGGAGFIGSHLCEHLVEMGAKVTVIDNLSTGNIDNLSPIKNKIKYIDIDISSLPNSIKTEKYDIIYHLAAVSSPRECEKDVLSSYRTNIAGTINTIQALLQNNQKIVFASSICVYEPDILPITENQKTGARQIYAYTKLVAEEIIKSSCKQKNCSYVILRFCNVYGPKQRRNFLVPTIITQALEKKEIEIWDPNPIRDYLFIDDAVSALIIAGKLVNNKIFNIGTGKGTSAGELASLICDILSVSWYDVHRPQNVPFSLVGDYGMFNLHTGWMPKVSLKEGIKKTIDYWKEKCKR